MLLFAADHGVAAEGVSIAPSAVTQLMVQNFLGGGAAINCFTRQLGWELTVIDAGILEPVSSDLPTYREQRIAAGTANFVHGPAMTIDQAEQSLQYGATVAREKLKAGSNLIACKP